MGEEMKHRLTKAVLGMYLVSTFVFCVTLAKDDPSGRSIWARLRPDAGSLGMYCISSAYPNFTLPDAVQAAADDGQRAQQTAPDTLTLIGTDGREAQVSEIITTEETAPEPVVFGEEPAVLIVHTHATESYLPSSGGNYHKKGKQNTVRDIGSVLAETLEANGIGVVHDQTLHDDPSYNQSYNRSYETTERLLKKYPSIVCVIDLHRDSILTDEGEAYKTSCTVDGAETAQLMFVVGTDAGGLYHPDWRDNLNFVSTLQYALNRAYPSLMRPVNLRTQRFDQHASPGSLLVEVGSSGNTLPEALSAVRLFADVLADEMTGM